MKRFFKERSAILVQRNMQTNKPWRLNNCLWFRSAYFPKQKADLIFTASFDAFVALLTIFKKVHIVYLLRHYNVIFLPAP
jgi:hypothetical protein